MHAIKNQLILLIIIDLLIVLLFALRILNIIGDGLNYGVSGIILDMLVVILSAYIIKSKGSYLQLSRKNVYKYFVYGSALLIFLP
ncbi:hypothetical protein EFL41_08755 [Weissella cibaria]|nr:hypothetical protein [Weissella cibaria]